MSSPELVVFIGSPASGKSTYYRKHYASTHVHINLDTFKSRSVERKAFLQAIEDKRSIVVDNTNPKAETRAKFIQPALEAGYAVTAIHFDEPFDVCKRRNDTRENRVPTIALRTFFQKFEKPELSEGFIVILTIKQTSPEKDPN